MPNPNDDWMASGTPDRPTTDSGWNIVGLAHIEGVVCKEIRPLTLGDGCLTEIWRADWGLDDLSVSQVYQRLMDPGAINGWHAHGQRTERLFCAAGRIRLSLYDGRKSSSSFGAGWQRVFGPERPLLVVIPPGVWHAVQSLGTVPSLLLNLVDKAYAYDNPDHWRLPPDTPHIPLKLL